MANTNFTVHNGLTVGPAFVYAGNGDIITSGNISVIGGGSFGGLSSNQIYQGSSNVTVGGSTVNIAISSSNVASFSSTGFSVVPPTGSNGFGTIYANNYSGSVSAYVVADNSFVHFGSASNTQLNLKVNGTTPAFIGTSGNLVVATATNSTSSTTGSIVTAGGIGVAQDAYIGGKLYVGGNTTFINTTIINTTDTLSAPTIFAGQIGNSGTTLTGTLSTASQTNITAVGTLTGLTVSGAIVPSSNASINLGGTSSQYFNNVYAVNFLGTSTTAKYADLAERYSSDVDYEAGTVVDFGGTAEVTLSNINGSQYVAGVVSTNPAYMMNSDADGLYIALVGRVPCKVTGPVEKGAMMVSNGDGTARMERNPKIGSVIGKALESFPDGVGVIEVVVGGL